MKLLYIVTVVFVLSCWIHICEPATLTLQGVIRDQSPRQFQPSDFEWRTGNDRGIVTPTIGADRKPVYAHGPNMSRGRTVHNQDTFYSWFHNTNITKNIPINITLSNDTSLSSDSRVFCYDNQKYFPINRMGWGNEGKSANYHFCLEVHAQFIYSGGEVFDFRGDDDVWVYINRRLVVDLGGVHVPQNATVYLDRLGLTRGTSYPFDFFFCERHSPGSSLRMCTSIVIQCLYYDWCGLCNGDGQSCCTGANNCDDGNACTEDLCDVQTGPANCRHNFRNCNDSNPCTIDACSDSSGCVRTPVDCDDNNMCTSDSCNPANGACVNTAITCVDTDPCTDNVCLPSSGCTYPPKNCNDNNQCTVDSCNATSGGCVHTPRDCDDGNACTADSCDIATGCRHVDQCGPRASCVANACVCDLGWYGANCSLSCEDMLVPVSSQCASAAPNRAVQFDATRVGTGRTVTWQEDCNNATFSSTTTKATTLNFSPSCPQTCSVTLTISNGDSCTGNVDVMACAGAVCGPSNSTNPCGDGLFYNGTHCIESNLLHAFGRSTDGAMGIKQGIAQTPTLVPDVPNRSIVYIAVSARHSLLCTNRDETYVAGANGNGQLGLGDTTNRNVFTKVTFFDGISVNVVAAGLYHSLVKAVDGRLYGFGRNAEGQLGVGTFTQRYLTPVQINFAAPVVGMAAGYKHTLMWTETQVYTFGSGSSGQTGLNVFTATNTPTLAFTAPAGTRIAGCAAGGHSSMIWTDNGRVYSFGANTYGNLGLGDNKLRKTPTLISDLSNVFVVFVTMAEQHTLFLTASGNIWATGNNTYGQLGVGDTISRNRPVRITHFDNVNEAVRGIGNGYTHSMLWTEQSMFVWGNNRKYQTGFTSTQVPTQTNRPVVHTFFSNQTVLTANSKGAYTLVLSKRN